MRYRAALPIVALLAACIFGIVVLAGGDWLPGIVTVGSALIGLVAQLREYSQRESRRSSPKSAR
jgi:hypothetical protein